MLESLAIEGLSMPHRLTPFVSTVFRNTVYHEIVTSYVPIR